MRDLQWPGMAAPLLVSGYGQPVPHARSTLWMWGGVGLAAAGVVADRRLVTWLGMGAIGYGLYQRLTEWVPWS